MKVLRDHTTYDKMRRPEHFIFAWVMFERKWYPQKHNDGKTCINTVKQLDLQNQR